MAHFFLIVAARQSTATLLVLAMRMHPSYADANQQDHRRFQSSSDFPAVAAGSVTIGAA
jgi:hypothetical protein